MFVVSFVFTYDTVQVDEGNSVYHLSFIIGRVIGIVLIPFGGVWFIRLIFRRKPMFTKGAFISWWVVSVLISLMALMGSMLPPEV